MNELFEKRGPVDMSPEAVGDRLRTLGELYKLGMSLRKAKPIVDDTDRKHPGLPLPVESKSESAASSSASQ